MAVLSAVTWPWKFLGIQATWGTGDNKGFSPAQAAIQWDTSAPQRKEKLLLPKNNELFWNNARFKPTCSSSDTELFLCLLSQAQGIKEKMIRENNCGSYKLKWWREFVRRALGLLLKNFFLTFLKYFRGHMYVRCMRELRKSYLGPPAICEGNCIPREDCWLQI